VFEPSKFISDVEVDSPTTKIYRFFGAIVHPGGERVPVGTENLLLRDCVLKNTNFVEGIVVYAGKFCRDLSTVLMYCIHLIVYTQFM
jgi:hypothetical protein